MYIIIINNYKYHIGIFSHRGGKKQPMVKVFKIFVVFQSVQ